MPSASTFNELQQYYQLLQTQAQQPYLKSTIKTIMDIGKNPMSNYQPIKNWNVYYNERFVNPANMELNNALKDINRSSERFSFGRRMREAQAKMATDSKINELVSADLLDQRKMAMQGLDSAYGRQLAALASFGQASQIPLQQPGQENFVQQKSLFGV